MSMLLPRLPLVDLPRDASTPPTVPIPLLPLVVFVMMVVDSNSTCNSHRKAVPEAHTDTIRTILSSFFFLPTTPLLPLLFVVCQSLQLLGLTEINPTTGSRLARTDLTTFPSVREKKRMAPSEHPMASRSEERIGIGLDVGVDLFRWDCVISSKVLLLFCDWEEDIFCVGCCCDCVMVLYCIDVDIGNSRMRLFHCITSVPNGGEFPPPPPLPTDGQTGRRPE